MAQEDVARIHCAIGQDHAHRLVQRRQRGRAHGQPGVGTAGHAQAEHAFVRQGQAGVDHQGACSVQVERAAEIRAGSADARQVLVQVARAVRPRGLDGLEDLEFVRQPGQEARLQPALGVFALRVAVVDDAGADAEFAAPQACARAEGQGADRHRQAEVAISLSARRRIEPADRAGVDAARVGFEFVDDFHGAAFRRAGDRAAGVERGEYLRQRRVRPQLRAHRGGHLQHGAEARDFEQLRHRHGAGLRHAAEVVAQQVDDHQVFGTVLGVERQVGGAARVDFRIAARRRRTLHRPRQQGAGRVAHEQLGREREQGAAVRQANQGAIRHRLARAQPLVQGEHRAEGIEAQAVGVVHLVGVAGCDVVADAVDGIHEPVFVDIRPHVGDAGRCGADCAGGDPARGLLRRHALAALEQQHLGQRHVRQRLGGDIEQMGAEFVAEHRHGELAARQRRFHLRQHGVPAGGVMAGEGAGVVGVEARLGMRLPVRARIVEQGKDCCGIHGTLKLPAGATIVRRCRPTDAGGSRSWRSGASAR